MKLTKQQISELKRVELNRLMIWLYCDKIPEYYGLYNVEDNGLNIDVDLGEYLTVDFLSDWNLLIPLVVGSEIEHGHVIGSQGAHYAIYLTPYIESKVLEVSRDKSLQRAYCEALVYLKVGV